MGVRNQNMPLIGTRKYNLMSNFVIKTGYSSMDIKAIHDFLCHESYWAKGISLASVHKSLQHSFCVDMFDGDKQIGFARLITDYTIFGYLADVYILKPYRGKGLSKQLIQYILDLDFVQKLRRMLLSTLDAQTLYQQLGYDNLAHPERMMELKPKNV